MAVGGGTEPQESPPKPHSTHLAGHVRVLVLAEVTRVGLGGLRHEADLQGVVKGGWQVADSGHGINKALPSRPRGASANRQRSPQCTIW